MTVHFPAWKTRVRKEGGEPHPLFKINICYKVIF
jgi:hypothetical protein